MSNPARHPEPELEVVWQRHLPQGLAKELQLSAISILQAEVLRLLLDERVGILQTGDLVVTVSRRPLP